MTITLEEIVFAFPACAIAMAYAKEEFDKTAKLYKEIKKGSDDCNSPSVINKAYTCSEWKALRKEAYEDAHSHCKTAFAVSAAVALYFYIRRSYIAHIFGCRRRQMNVHR